MTLKKGDRVRVKREEGGYWWDDREEQFPCEFAGIGADGDQGELAIIKPLWDRCVYDFYYVPLDLVEKVVTAEERIEQAIDDLADCYEWKISSGWYLNPQDSESSANRRAALFAILEAGV